MLRNTKALRDVMPGLRIDIVSLKRKMDQLYSTVIGQSPRVYRIYWVRSGRRY